MRKADEIGRPLVICGPSSKIPSVENLTSAELRLLVAFRWLNGEQKKVYFDAICDCASEQQAIARARKPALRVVKGGRNG